MKKYQNKYYLYSYFNIRNKKDILDASLFIELIHTGLLVHDDIQDKEDIRRGLKTIHNQFQDEGKRIVQEHHQVPKKTSKKQYKRRATQRKAGREAQESLSAPTSRPAGSKPTSRHVA